MVSLRIILASLQSPYRDITPNTRLLQFFNNSSNPSVFFRYCHFVSKEFYVTTNLIKIFDLIILEKGARVFDRMY